MATIVISIDCDTREEFDRVWRAFEDLRKNSDLEVTKDMPPKGDETHSLQIVIKDAPPDLVEAVKEMAVQKGIRVVDETV